MLTGSCPTVIKSQQKVDQEIKMLRVRCPKFVKASTKSRPGDENIDGKLLKIIRI